MTRRSPDGEYVYVTAALTEDEIEYIRKYWMNPGGSIDDGIKTVFWGCLPPVKHEPKVGYTCASAEEARVYGMWLRIKFVDKDHVMVYVPDETRRVPTGYHQGDAWVIDRGIFNAGWTCEP